MSPRPPAPCSLAPGLPLPRRPAHRRLLAVVALAVLLIAASVSALPADEIIENESYIFTVRDDISSIQQYTSPNPNTSAYVGFEDAKILGVRHPQNITPTAMVFHPDSGVKCSNTSIFYDVVPFTMHRSTNKAGPVVGDGERHYYKNPDDDTDSYCIFTFDDWNWSAAGNYDLTTIYLEYHWGDKPEYTLSLNQAATSIEADTNYLELPIFCVAPGSFSKIKVEATYTINMESDWVNRLSAIRDGDSVLLAIEKTIDGKTSIGKAVLKAQNKVNPYTSTDIDPYDIYVIAPLTDAPFELSVYSPASGNWYNRTAFGEYSDNPSNPIHGGLTLTLSPSSGTVNSPITAALSTSAATPRYSEITYAITDPAGNVAYDTYSLDQETWTTWQHYNKTSWQFDPSSETAAHNPVITPISAGIWTVTATIRDRQPPGTGEALASASATCEVSRAAGNVDVAISIYDGAASSTPLLYGVGVLVEDLTTNGTVLLDTREYRLDGWTGTTNGRVTVQAPLGHQIRTTAQKQGYVTRAQTDYVQPTAVPLNQMPVNIVLSPATTPGPEQVYLTVLVTDLRSQPIQGATVTAAGKAGTTGAQGTCRLSVPLNQTISWIVRADGYHGASGIALPLDANSQMTVQLQPTTIPTTPGETPGGPGATPTPDHRTNEQKGQAVIDMIADNAEGIGALALICLLMGLLKLLAKW